MSVEAKCDICGLSVEYDDLLTLKEQYQNKHIKDACKSCVERLNSADIKIAALLSERRESWLRWLMKKMAAHPDA